MAGYKTKINKICRLLRRDGFAVEIEYSKHLKIHFSKDDFSAYVVAPSTPSDTNAIKHVIKDIRKKLNAANYNTLDHYACYLVDSEEFLNECVSMYKQVAKV